MFLGILAHFSGCSSDRCDTNPCGRLSLPVASGRVLLIYSRAETASPLPAPRGRRSCGQGPAAQAGTCGGENTRCPLRSRRKATCSPCAHSHVFTSRCSFKVWPGTASTHTQPRPRRPLTGSWVLRLQGRDLRWGCLLGPRPGRATCTQQGVFRLLRRVPCTPRRMEEDSVRSRGANDSNKHRGPLWRWDGRHRAASVNRGPGQDVEPSSRGGGSAHGFCNPEPGPSVTRASDVRGPRLLVSRFLWIRVLWPSRDSHPASHQAPVTW